MKNLIMHKKGEASMVTWTKKRITKVNGNLNGLFSGETGIGKSLTNISFAEQLDPSFDAEKQIAFSFLEVMQIINSDWFKKKKTKIILFDEPQISISNKEWQTKVNKLFNYLLSTFRHQNIVLLFATPYADFLDSTSMKLVHVIFECCGIDRKRNLSHVRPKILQYNSRMKKFYYHSLHVVRDSKVVKMRDWYVKKPSQKNIDIFERRRDEFTAKLNKDIMEELEEIENPTPEEEVEKKELTDKQEEVLRLVREGKGAIEISEVMGKSLNATYSHLKALKRKGYHEEIKKYRKKPLESTHRGALT